MGRYDKIKVYHDGQWKTPKAIRVYQFGQWIELGNDTSFNTNTLKVFKDGEYLRATLNRVDTVVILDQYAKGQFSLYPKAGYCYCPKSTSAGSYDWSFKANIEKSVDSDQNIFYCGTGYDYAFIDVTWLADGRIRVRTKWNTTSVSTGYSSNRVYKDTPVDLDVTAVKGEYTINITFNGVKTTIYNMGGSFKDNGSSNKVGDTYTKIRNTVIAKGVSGSSYTYSISFNANTVSGTNNSAGYVNVNHYEETRTDTTYE